MDGMSGMVGISEVDGTNVRIWLPQISESLPRISEWPSPIAFSIADYGSALPVRCSGLPNSGSSAAIPFFDNSRLYVCLVVGIAAGAIRVQSPAGMVTAQAPIPDSVGLYWTITI